MNLRGAAEILVGSTYQPVNDLPNSTRDEIINHPESVWVQSWSSSSLPM